MSDSDQLNTTSETMQVTGVRNYKTDARVIRKPKKKSNKKEFIHGGDKYEEKRIEKIQSRKGESLTLQRMSDSDHPNKTSKKCKQGKIKKISLL